jgi:hypothetical protein
VDQFEKVPTLSSCLVVVNDKGTTWNGEPLKLCQAHTLAPADRTEAVAGRLEAVIRIQKDEVATLETGLHAIEPLLALGPQLLRWCSSRDDFVAEHRARKYPPVLQGGDPTIAGLHCSVEAVEQLGIESSPLRWSA